MNYLSFFTALLTIISASTAYGQIVDDSLQWQEGYLDIHHINTARGNATFFIFPDGTTLLFDAGDKRIPPDKAYEYFPIPGHDSLSAGGLIAQYIKRVMPAGKLPQIDYALISHFHNDHYGQIDSSSKVSSKGNYRLSGITEVGDLLPIKTLIDRNYPAYDYPVDLKKFYKHDETFINYLAFIHEQKAKSGLVVEKLIAGSKDQIKLKIHLAKFKTFSVRNIKTNATIWTGQGNKTIGYPFDRPLVKENYLNENALSLVLKVSYGSFDYYTGGDLTGTTQWGNFDLETPVAKVVGKVDALALNHHGYFDATNAFFLRTLSPTVVVHQVIHDPHYQPDVLKRLSVYPFHLFTYNMHLITSNTFPQEVSRLYKSTQGHILIRVMPAGEQYYLYTLNENNTALMPTKRYGPYSCDKKTN